MKTTLRIGLFLIIGTGILAAGKMCAFWQPEEEAEAAVSASATTSIPAPAEARTEATIAAETNESSSASKASSRFYWDDELADWIETSENKPFQAQAVHYDASSLPTTAPIRVSWKLLMDIEYKLQYYEVVKVEMYAPIFPEALKALDGKEVVVEGFVIPFDEDISAMVALSANPYASCFFCGKASPASVMSVYFKNKGKRYKIDDYRIFTGTLQLNYNDPNEFYYILRGAVVN